MGGKSNSDSSLGSVAAQYGAILNGNSTIAPQPTGGIYTTYPESLPSYEGGAQPFQAPGMNDNIPGQRQSVFDQLSNGYDLDPNGALFAPPQAPTFQPGVGSPAPAPYAPTLENGGLIETNTGLQLANPAPPEPIDWSKFRETNTGLEALIPPTQSPFSGVETNTGQSGSLFERLWGTR